jgi:RimJ/RimL family protein N-acetyltransferase
MTLRVGLVGDRDAAVLAHRAIPQALARAAAGCGVAIEPVWLATEQLAEQFDGAGCAGLWCVPGSPYRSTAGALRAIRHARERDLPFLGTCGGFQHAIIEYARDVLGWRDAEHAETAPTAARTVIAPLACGLVEQRGSVHLRRGTRIARAYGTDTAVEGYHCRYGLSPEFATALLCGPLRATASDDAGEIRAVELDGHRFFVATLFQPERAALTGRLPPLVRAFIDACLPESAAAAASTDAAVACASARLELRHLSVHDADFIHTLLNDRDYVHFIGDRGVRTRAAAARYIEEVAVASYARHGFGLYLVARKLDGAPIGIAGLVRRDGFDEVELGYALLPQYRGQGYALEAARAALRLGREQLGMQRIVATTSPDNQDSIKLLRRLGLEFERMIRLPGYARESCLYAPGSRS